MKQKISGFFNNKNIFYCLFFLWFDASECYDKWVFFRKENEERALNWPQSGLFIDFITDDY